MKLQYFIFDFGDVFINLDKPATLRALRDLGLDEFTEEMIKKNRLYEKGLCSTDDFLSFYQRKFPQLSKEELRAIWNEILLDFPAYRLKFLEDFSQKNKCYLLSNINEIHVDYIKKQVGAPFYNRFISCFEKVYYTHEIHLRKPDAEVYEYVFKDAGINPEACFFVDDKIENIRTAASLGVRCWHIQPGKDDIIHLESFIASHIN